MGDTGVAEQVGQVHRLVDRAGTDEDRTAGAIDFDHFIDDRRPFRGAGAVDTVGQVAALWRAVGGHRDGLHLVQPSEFGARVARGAGHSAEVFVAQEQILDRDAGGLAGGDGDFQSLFGLDRLMDPIAPLAAFR